MRQVFFNHHLFALFNIKLKQNSSVVLLGISSLCDPKVLWLRAHLQNEALIGNLCGGFAKMKALHKLSESVIPGLYNMKLD